MLPFKINFLKLIKWNLFKILIQLYYGIRNK